MKSIRITNNAPAVLYFSLVCLVVLVLDTVFRGAVSKMLFVSYGSYWYGSLGRAFLNPLAYIRFFTHAFGHAGWGHFFGNISFILLLGPMLEEKYGTKKIIEIMAITAFAAGLVNFFLFPGTAIQGASGIVFAFIMLSSFTSFREGEIPVTAILVAVFFFGKEIYNGTSGENGISELSHILGGIVGAVVGYQLNIKKKPVPPENSL